jgi:hypothetical protein
LTRNAPRDTIGEGKAKVNGGPAPAKAALEELLRQRRLHDEGPPLRGARRLSPLPTGVDALDRLLGGGLPRGQVSEVRGTPSSGRTGLLLCLVARATGQGGLVAWVDPGDRLDPLSAAEAGVDLDRLFWLRGALPGRGATAAVSALGTLAASGLFELLVLDLAGAGALEVRRLPGSTWIRLQRLIEASPAAVVLLAEDHVASGPAGASLLLSPANPARWSGAEGPGRLLQGLETQARLGRLAPRAAPFFLAASS